MVIMIISFRDKRNTDWLDQTDTRIEDEIAHPLS